MLAISPPLHKDVPVRRFTSPGDGFRAYVPPPVDPAFHFLAALLVPVTHASALRKAPPRPPLDPALYGSLSRALDLPLEVLELIARNVVEAGTGPALARSSRFLCAVTVPQLYHTLDLRTSHDVASVARTLRQKPWLGIYIREVRVRAYRLHWTDMNAFVDALGANAARIDHLQVSFPASDLPQAVRFLSAFSPKTFEWMTSPCWQMRPAHLFLHFMSRWHRLEQLKLGSFRFDDVVLQFLGLLPSLSRLTLAGSATKHLESRLIKQLLETPCTAPAQESDAMEVDEDPSFPWSAGARYLDEIEILDCPLDRRLALEAELCDDLVPALRSKVTWQI